MDNICNSINSLSILKFIIKSINKDTQDIKLIFIGPQIEKTQNILKKNTYTYLKFCFNLYNYNNLCIK